MEGVQEITLHQLWHTLTRYASQTTKKGGGITPPPDCNFIYLREVLKLRVNPELSTKTM